LDLTRATLCATLKYPRLSAEGVPKYGAYRSEEAELQFARALHPESPPSIEAQIMDWADDITYSVHDTEDFYRAGRIPLDRLAVSRSERNAFLERAARRRQAIGKPFKESAADLQDVFDRFCESLRTKEPYTGTRSQRGQLREFTSKTISDYIQNTRLLPPPGKNGRGLEILDDYLIQVTLLKELTWCYVINNPALAAHQYGQRRAIRTLFEIFLNAAERRDWTLFPFQFQEEANELLLQEGEIAPARRARLVADTIASLTDKQALRLYQRLTGLSQGSALDPIASG
jgi:dGTPase